MDGARDAHTATLLSDGTVLVAGGGGPVIPGGHTSSFDLLASAELFDPSTGSWTATGSMNEARYVHTATLLRNGTVLVIGATTGSAELYDPSTRTWTVTGSMTEARDIAGATLLPDGTVLVAGGYSSSGPLGLGMLASAELYDPSSGTWTATGSMITARSSTQPRCCPMARCWWRAATRQQRHRPTGLGRAVRPGQRDLDRHREHDRGPQRVTRPRCCPMARCWWRSAPIKRGVPRARLAAAASTHWPQPSCTTPAAARSRPLPHNARVAPAGLTMTDERRRPPLILPVVRPNLQE